MPHVFLSYVREDWDKVKKLHDALATQRIPVWLDRISIKAGARWKNSIRKAIREGDFFIACFSSQYAERGKTHANEEITIAIEELRQMPFDREWFIPVRFDDCRIPDRPIGAGETLSDIQRVDLFSDWDAGLEQILTLVKRKYIETIISEHIKFTYILGALIEESEFPLLHLAVDNSNIIFELPLHTSSPLSYMIFDALIGTQVASNPVSRPVKFLIKNTQVVTFRTKIKCHMASQGSSTTSPVTFAPRLLFLKDISLPRKIERIEQIKGGRPMV